MGEIQHDFQSIRWLAVLRVERLERSLHPSYRDSPIHSSQAAPEFTAAVAELSGLGDSQRRMALRCAGGVTTEIRGWQDAVPCVSFMPISDDAQ